MNHTSIKTLYATAVAVVMTLSTPSWGAPEDEDIAIFGSGSSAFAAAIHASSKGARVTMIEEGTIGGTCVNVGCVPSKIFIQSGKTAHTQREHPFDGVEKHEPVVDFRAMRRQQQKRVLELRESKYSKVLAEHPNITFLQGTASLLAADRVSVQISADETVELNPTKILIATGSTPNIPAIPGLSDTPFWTSKEALAGEELPHHLVVIGGSVVALELAQAFVHHGSKVTMLARSTLLSREDPDIGESLKGIFEEEGVDVLTHTVPDSVTHEDGAFRVLIGDRTLTADRLLVATGRGGNTDRLGLEAVGVETDPQGKIIVDDHLRTSVETIFSSGDCSNMPQYVYVAAAAGSTAAVNMLGGDSSLDLSIVPGVTFTEPQVATVGLNTAQAEAMGMEVDSRTLTLDNVPRALANFDTRGFIKLVAQRETGEILGAQIVASGAGDVIQTAAMAIRGHMTVREMAAQLFPYLTMVEGLKLCAQTFFTDVKKLSCCASTVVEDEVTVEKVGGSGDTEHGCCSQDREEEVTEAAARPQASRCFLEATCEAFCQTMIKYVPGLPKLVAKMFISQYPVPTETEQGVSLRLIHLLTEGNAVDPQVLSDTASVPLLDVQAMLERWPDVYFDASRHIVGFGGLTFQPTKHKITFNDRTLYTWCAWDTLFLPAILGEPLDIESESPLDQSIVRVRADRNGVESVYPEESVISFVMPTKGCIQQDVKTNFCRFINFFPSEEAGQEWTKLHPGTYLISIQDAFEIGRMKNAAQYGNKI